MLASGAILDYGSIRQFAAKHDKYRYNDVDRYSASLAEQRGWARSLVQVFAQTMAFIESGVKESLDNFKNADCLRVFDEAFASERDQRMLWRIGFTPEQITYLMSNARKEIRDLDRSLRYFEDRKVKKGIEKLPDGFTHSPVFLIRNLLRLLPAYYVAQTISRADDTSAYMPDDIFCRIMAASYVGKQDLKPTPCDDVARRRFSGMLPAPGGGARWSIRHGLEDIAGALGSDQSPSSHHGRRGHVDHRRSHRHEEVRSGSTVCRKRSTPSSTHKC